jgi:hypothetical protein
VWTRKGRIFEAPGGVPFVSSHAALPVVEDLGGGHRVYFSGRDARGRSRVAYFDLDLDDAVPIRGVSQHPALDLGTPGAFDDSGVTTSCLVNHGSLKYLFYTGWSLGVTVPFYLFAGLAVSDDGGETFKRVSKAPILPRSASDPYLTASPWVLIEAGLWRMWYVSGSEWRIESGSPRHYYDIRYAESRNGIDWKPSGHVCVTYAAPGEHAFARPCVIRERGLYRMWYAFRGDRYRLGYAESTDGLEWQRQDRRAGLEPAAQGWDSEMLCYPCVFSHGGERLLLYNGNDFGRTGIGLAVESRDGAVGDS